MSNETAKRFIQDNYVTLKENLDTKRVVDYCFENYEINQGDKEEIHCEKCCSNKNGLLLDKLLRSTKRTTLKTLTDALRKYQPDLLHKLRAKSPIRHQTYAEAVKKPDSPVVHKKTFEVPKHVNCDNDEDFITLQPSNILKRIKRIEQKLLDALSRIHQFEIMKYLHIFKEVFTFYLNESHLSVDYFKTSNIHEILTNICKLEPVADNTPGVNDVYLNVKLDALELMSDMSRSNCVFCKNLCNAASISLLFCVLTNDQKVCKGLRSSRITWLRSKMLEIYSAALQVVCNLISCEICDLSLFGDFQKSEILKKFINSEDEEHRVTSVLILIYLNRTSELNSTEIVTMLSSWLKKVLEQTSRESIFTPNAFSVILGLTKLSLISPFSQSIREDQYIKSVIGTTDCWKYEPKAAILFLKLVSTLNMLTPGSSKGSQCRSDTVTIEMSETNLLLIGCSGAGKSSLGNSLLGKSVFSVNDCREKETTRNISLEMGTFNGRILKILDTPGVGNSFSVRKLCKAMNEALSKNQSGFQAILLVIKYEFTKFKHLDLKPIEDFKKIFGKFFLRDYGVLVFTFGDYFENGRTIKRLSFEDWLQHQDGPISELIKECKNRVVLFDNVTQDENRKFQQLCRLMGCVDRIRFTDYTFSCENFNRAKGSREKLIRDETDKEIHTSILEEIKLTEGDLEKVKLKIKPEDQTGQLQKLIERARTLKVRIDELISKHSNDYLPLATRVNKVISDSENQIKLLIGIKNNKKKFKSRFS